MTMRSRVVLFIGYTACVLAVNARALSLLLDISTHDATASHLPLIPFVSLWLIYRRRQTIFTAVHLGGAPAIALVLLGAGFASFGGPSLSVTVLGLVIMGLGGFMFFFGGIASRAALFPLLFLCFAIPLPTAVIDGVTHFLKAGSTEATEALFRLVGQPYYRHGFVFSLPTVAIEIGDECSGIRSSIALLLTCLIAGHLLLTTWWKHALLISLAVPLAIAKNAVRIVVLTLLGAHVNPGFLNGQLHREGGILFYLLALGMLAPFLYALHRSDRYFVATGLDHLSGYKTTVG